MPMIQYIHKRISADKLRLIEQANDIIDIFKAQGYQLTLRQLYYQFVSRDLIPNNQKSYNRLGNVISDGRMLGLIDWEDISDRLREIRSVGDWESPASAMRSMAHWFKIDLWEGQEYRPEVWVEKDALAEVVERAAHALRVSVMVCRGYMSQSAMWEAGHDRYKEWVDQGVTPVVIHLGDHDPSGIDMTRDIKDRLEMFADGEVEVRRIALNMDQVEQYNPPPNPAKITDSRAEGYIAIHGDESWELDALEPRVLSKLIQDEILSVRDERKWKRKVREENEHKANLELLSDNYEAVLKYAQKV